MNSIAFSFSFFFFLFFCLFLSVEILISFKMLRIFCSNLHPRVFRIDVELGNFFHQSLSTTSTKWLTNLTISGNNNTFLSCFYNVIKGGKKIIIIAKIYIYLILYKNYTTEFKMNIFFSFFTILSTNG